MHINIHTEDQTGTHTDVYTNMGLCTTVHTHTHRHTHTPSWPQVTSVCSRVKRLFSKKKKKKCLHHSL